MAGKVGEGLREEGALELGLRVAGGCQEVGAGRARTWLGITASSPRNGPTQMVNKLRCFHQKSLPPLKGKNMVIFFLYLNDHESTY